MRAIFRGGGGRRSGRGGWPVGKRTAVALLVGPAALLIAACGTDELPTYRVESRIFEHRVTAEGTLKAVTSTPLTVPTEVRRTVRLAWLASEGTRVEAGDPVARFDPTEMKERLEQGQSDRRSADVEVDKAHVESGVKLTELETKLRVANLELAHAQKFQKTDDAVFSRHDIVESEIDEALAGERKSHATDSRKTRESLSRTELDLLAIQQRKAQLTIEQAQEGLAALEVRAPHAGILSLARNWRGEVTQVGAEMWRGQKIAEIPDLSSIEAEVFVLEADAGGLAVDKPATLVVEAEPGTTYPATIQRVDAVAKSRFRGSPVQYFGVTLAFEGEPGPSLKPGQRVRATLMLERVEDALVVPRQAVVQESGESRVFVRSRGRFEPRRVETGASSLGLVVVTAGLAEGDVVALSPPGVGADEAPDEAGGESGAPASVATGPVR